MSDIKLSSLIKKPLNPLTPDNEQQPQPGVDPRKQLEEFLHSIAEYRSFGKALKQATTMREVGQKLSNIASLAEQAVLSEAGDFYDAHTLKRNMKELKTYTGDFSKLAQEADTINHRMYALYEDMGRVLERYFELPDEQVDVGAGETEEAPVLQQEPQPLEDDAPVAPGRFITVDELREFARRAAEVGSRRPTTLEEDALELEDPEPARPVKEDPESSDPGSGTHLETGPEAHEPENKEPVVDELTLRAIKAVYDNLKRTNPEYAARFKALPAKKMVDAVWKLVR